jgi:hypothetical protein
VSGNLQFTVLAEVVMMFTKNAAVCHGTFVPHGLYRTPANEDAVIAAVE